MEVNITKLYHKVFLKRSDSQAKIKLIAIADRYNKPINTVEVEFTAFLGKYMLAYIKKSITDQRLNGRHMKRIYKPLSESYRKTKPKKTQSMHWVNTGELLKSLTVRYNKSKTAIVITTKSKYHGNSNTTNADIIKWNELGTKKMPARPLFKPAIDNIIRNLSQIVDLYHKSNY